MVSPRCSESGTWRRRGRSSPWRGHAAYRCVAFSPDGKKLAAGTFDCAVELYRTEGDVAMLDGFWKDLGEPINALAFLPNGGGQLVAGDWAGKLLFFQSTAERKHTA